jgi:competence protein ComEC
VTIGLGLLADAARAERHRWPLWLPVILGTGAAFYFALPVEPALVVFWAAGAAALVAAIAAAGWGRTLLALLAALLLGFSAAKLREESIAAPVLSRSLTLHLTGRLVAADPAPRGMRLIVGDLRSGGLADAIPGRARILVLEPQKFRAGDGLSLTARLMPPPGPTEPGDSDFGRDAFFERLNAVGFSYGAPIPAPLAKPPTPT